MKRIVGFGASHLGAVIQAAKNQALLRRLDVELTLLSFLDYTPIVNVSAGKFDVNAEFAAAFRASVRADPAPELVFCTIGGGDHIVLGLAQHERPFDFVIPPQAIQASPIVGVDYLSMLKDCEILPYDLFVGIMRTRVSAVRSFVKWIRSITDIPICVMCLPPPIKDEEFIMKHPGRVLNEQLEKFGISPIALRYKLWWLQASAQSEVCGETGVTFLPVPDDAMDETGCLRKELYAGDPVHANGSYGEMVIEQLCAIDAAATHHRNKAQDSQHASL